MKYLTGLILFIAMFVFGSIASSGTVDVMDPEVKQTVKIYDKHDGVYDPKLIPIEWNPVTMEPASINYYYLTLEPSQYNKTYFDGYMVVYIKIIDKDTVLLLSYSYYNKGIYYQFDYDEELDKYKQINPGGV